MSIITMNPLIRILGIGVAESEIWPIKEMKGMWGGLHYHFSLHTSSDFGDMAYSVTLTVPDIALIQRRYILLVHPRLRWCVFKQLDQGFAAIAGEATNYVPYTNKVAEALFDKMNGAHLDMLGYAFGEEEPKEEDLDFEVFDVVVSDYNVSNVCWNNELAKELAENLIAICAYRELLDPGATVWSTAKICTEHYITANRPVEAVRILERFGITNIKPVFIKSHPHWVAVEFEHYGYPVMYDLDTAVCIRNGVTQGQFDSVHHMVAHLNIVGNKEK